MPKIVAPTVSENRSVREATILETATQIAYENGLDKINFDEIARQTGLSRTAIYTYFKSSADLIADVLMDELHEMTEFLKQAVSNAATLESAVMAWVRLSLEYVDNGRHQFMKSMASVELPETRRSQLMNLHRHMAMPLVESLAKSSVPEPEVWAQQISGVVDVSMKRLINGGNLEKEIATIERFVMPALAPYVSARLHS